MIQKKALLVVVGVFFGCLGMSTEASAVAYGGAENFVVSEEDNKKAIAIVEENGGLENCPVPVENLTTQQPVAAEMYSLKTTRAALKAYPNNGYAKLYMSWQFYSRELVPTGFNWDDNGIPGIALNWGWVTKPTFTFIPGKVVPTGSAGYGTGGYFWSEYKSTVQGGSGPVTVYYWLSAWDINHLLYG